MAQAKRIENTLTNKSFREIFQSSVEGIIIVNQEGIIKMANPISEKMFAYEEGELIGVSIEQLINKNLREGHRNLRHGFHANPSPRRMGAGRDLTALRKDGTEFPVEISLSYVTISSQFLITAFIIDITERKKVEEALKRSEEQLILYAGELEKKVSARTEDLKRLVAKLEWVNTNLEKEIGERKKAEEEARIALERERELNDLKTKFVSIASHEFRTPLSTVMSSASLIGQYKERGEIEKIERHVERIRSSVNHLTGILNDFLSLGKLEEGKMDFAIEEIRLPQFITDVTEEVSSILKQGQKLKLEFDGIEQTIKSDPRILRNILFNLISNASKYSNAGSIIQVLVEYGNDLVSISINDSGIGIPKTEHKFLFDRFFRATNSSNSEGTGLGLHIVKRYLELLNGTIEFKSEENVGSQFTIHLPYKFL